MKIIDLKQGTREWLNWRADGLGGSDIGPIYLRDAWPYEDSGYDAILREKVAYDFCQPAQDNANYAMRRGKALEPVGRQWYESTTGIEAPPACVEHDTIPFCRVSLDGLARDHIVEVKALDAEDHNAALAGIVPRHYLPQIQWQLLATGLPYCIYLSITDSGRFSELDKIVALRVDAYPEFQAELLEAARKVWDIVVRQRGKRELSMEALWR